MRRTCYRQVRFCFRLARKNETLLSQNVDSEFFSLSPGGNQETNLCLCVVVEPTEPVTVLIEQTPELIPAKPFLA